MVNLVLRQAVADAALVGEYAGLVQPGIDSHFLEKPALGSSRCRLTRAGVAAARICPQSAAVILVIRSTLEENSAIAVVYEDRESTMKPAARVSVELRRCTDRFIVLVHKDY